MLTFWGERRKLCDGQTRRDFLRIGAFGGMLTLADLLRGQSPGAYASGSPSNAAGSPKKAAIMIYLPGGPTHMDTYDLKPDAPVEFRGELKPINTNVPGIGICELMPRQAAMMDKLAIIRSVSGAVEEHSDAQVMSGWSENQNRNVGRPALGAVMSKLRASASPDIPPFVSLRGMSIGLEPGYLGKAHRAFTPEGQGMANLRLHASVDKDQLEDRKALLAVIDKMRTDIDHTGTMAGVDSFTQRAFDIVTSGAIRKALDISQEDPRVRDRYGKGTQFLLARRLVEAGVGCVTLQIGSWDTHDQNFRAMRNMLPDVDQAVSALVEDLYRRGLDKDVALVMWGEFGRTPKVNGNAGRDHWPQVMSCLLAGGGMKMGQVIGSTNSRGEYAKDRPVTVQNIIATLYHQLGIDPAMTFNNDSGRPIHLLDDRQVVRELV
jgi:uncharacterized protein (DUF1501 family)